MSVKDKPKSRWNRGNERYPKKTLDTIYEKYREPHGWHKGARVLRK